MKLLKDTAIYTLGNLLPKVAAFLLLPLYTRCMSTTDYGIVSLLVVVTFILDVLFSLAIDRSMYRLYYDYKTVEQKKAYMGTLFLSLLFVSTIMMLLIFPLRGQLSILIKGIPVEKFFTATILTSYLSVFRLIPLTYFRVEMRPWRFLSYSLGEYLLLTVFVVYFVVFQQLGAWGMILGGLIAKSIMTVFYLMALVRLIYFRFDLSIFRASLKFSLPIIPGLMSGWIIMGIDRIFIEHYYGMSEVGVYSLGYRLASLVLLLLTAFAQAYSPYFYKEASSADQVRAKERLWVCNNAFMAVAILAATGLSLFAKDLVVLAFDERFVAAYVVVPVVAFGCMVCQTAGILHFSAYQNKKTMPIVWVLIITAVLNVLLNWWLIPNFGAMGAAWSTLISFSIGFVVKYFLVKRYYFIPLSFKLLLPVLCLAIITLYAASLISCALWLSLFIKSMIGVTLCGLVVLWMVKCLFPTGFHEGLQLLR